MLGDAALVLLVAAAVDGRVFLYQTFSHRVALGRLSRLPGFYCGGIFIAVLVYSKSKAPRCSFCSALQLAACALSFVSRRSRARSRYCTAVFLSASMAISCLREVKRK
eukprot:Plantae.Rhodophyta-Palmaria_palmata.ctg19003.p1 GENE.Plantae.Rhodophyta-Palmaria_palmata.ctg19003~~Plantae.Rhodophyta-Palmaria_palmata.ctg19003.p1  ORF type:complete len:108 (-),score=10.82 Plantae.Rhodophyta-Palmaria_palmata.ctg19003:985-1308(-)